MKKLIDISNINSFCAKNDVIAVVFKNSIVQLLNEYFEINYEKDIGENLQDIFIYNNFIWTNTAMDGKAVIFSNGNITIENFYLITIKNDFLYISKGGKDKKVNKSDEVMWEISDGLFVYKFLYHELCYIKNKNELVLLDDLNGKKLWSFTLLYGKYNWESNGPYPTKYNGEINSIIGSFNNTLWVVLNSGMLIGIDLNSGKMEYELVFPNKSDEDFTNSNNVFLYSLHTKLDELRVYFKTSLF